MSTDQRIPEEYIQYIWQYGLFDDQDLQTSAGIPLQIHHRGQLNFNSGPDFLNARISIGGQEWAGNVEIHFQSSDWDVHAHQRDEAYDNVILHVVLHHDREVRNNRGANIPTLSLSSRFSITHFRRYRSLINNRNWIPCAGQLDDVDELTIRQMMDRTLVDRLEQKARLILEDLERSKGDWNHTMYICLARAFGGKVNAEPFALLTRITPLEIVHKHKDEVSVLEALFIGQAGFLEEDFEELYPNELKISYEFLKHKYGLQPMKKVAWRNSKVRPSSLPLLRLAQFARIWQQRKSLFSLILDAEPIVLNKLFAIRLDGYWNSHYTFDNESAERVKSVGKATVNGVIINTVVPLLYAHSIHLDDLNSRERALSLLEALPAEENAIIRSWADQGVEAGNSFESQALIQMKRHHCDAKACINCSIGVSLLKDRSEKNI